MIDVHFGVLGQVFVFQARLVKLDIVPVALPILREIPDTRLTFLEMPGGTEVGEFLDYIEGVGVKYTRVQLQKVFLEEKSGRIYFLERIYCIQFVGYSTCKSNLKVLLIL